MLWIFKVTTTNLAWEKEFINPQDRRKKNELQNNEQNAPPNNDLIVI